VFPFGGGFGSGGNASTRYQQAYASSDFSSIGSPFLITSIDFLGGSGKLAPSTYNLYFSTITAGIDSLSDVNFDSNRGADNTFFASVTLTGTAPATLTFSGIPFNYNPAHGNLLLDIVVSPGGVDANSGFGAAYFSTSNAFGIFSRYHNFGVGNAGWGLVTEFDYQAPEPSAAALLCTVAVVAVGLRRWRRPAQLQTASLALNAYPPANHPPRSTSPSSTPNGHQSKAGTNHFRDGPGRRGGWD
jgi:hypothetical protein